MARTVKLAPTERQIVAPSRFSGIRNNLPAIVGAAALVAAGALASTALANGALTVEMVVTLDRVRKPAWRWSAITTAETVIDTATGTEVRAGHRLAQTLLGPFLA